jgi:hypothetical protein
MLKGRARLGSARGRRGTTGSWIHSKRPEGGKGGPGAMCVTVPNVCVSHLDDIAISRASPKLHATSARGVSLWHYFVTSMRHGGAWAVTRHVRMPGAPHCEPQQRTMLHFACTEPQLMATSVLQSRRRQRQ